MIMWLLTKVMALNIAYKHSTLRSQETRSCAESLAGAHCALGMSATGMQTHVAAWLVQD